MGTLGMPKHNAQRTVTLAVLRVYSEYNDWMNNDTFRNQLKVKLGRPHEENQAYTKKSQIPAYFGFVEWENPSDERSRRRITSSGKQFLFALEQSNNQIIVEEILKSLETRTFGRHPTGTESDSDVEPPQVFIKCALILGYLDRGEYGYILWQLDKKGSSILDLLAEIANNRLKSNHTYEDPPYPDANRYNDAKPITALINWKFLTEDAGSRPGKIAIAPYVLENYLDRLQALQISNVDQLTNSPSSVDQASGMACENAKNVIYYGAPGSGKSFIVSELIVSKEARTRRVTFHPEYDHASFVGSYKPIMSVAEDGERDLSYEFVPQVFSRIYVDAWNDLRNDYYLVIEEINRGNCSEIFGDIFQLLDRKNNYPVTPFKELKNYLDKELAGNTSISSEKMLLPPNLAIFATMNTSDQSLFPMDSAFKRRWDWEYVPINYEKSRSNLSSEFIVKISESESFSWIDFIKTVNEIIKNNENLGMDKCIGNYFVNPANRIIELKIFVSKVLFYLWNDVFKDELEDASIFKGRISYEDFFPLQTNGMNRVREMLVALGIEINQS